MLSIWKFWFRFWQLLLFPPCKCRSLGNGWLELGADCPQHGSIKREFKGVTLEAIKLSPQR